MILCFIVYFLCLYSSQIRVHSPAHFALDSLHGHRLRLLSAESMSGLVHLDVYKFLVIIVTHRARAGVVSARADGKAVIGEQGDLIPNHPGSAVSVTQSRRDDLHSSGAIPGKIFLQDAIRPHDIQETCKFSLLRTGTASVHNVAQREAAEFGIGPQLPIANICLAAGAASGRAGYRPEDSTGTLAAVLCVGRVGGRLHPSDAGHDRLFAERLRPFQPGEAAGEEAHSTCGRRQYWRS